MNGTKPFDIPKQLIMNAYKSVKANAGVAGIDEETIKWKYDWVLEFDIKGMFDNIDHELLMKAVRKHTDCKWIILYTERWLKASMQMPDGTVIERHNGTPQGGVISPLLANLFMHYVFDVWITREFPDCPWCRYADDGLVHCQTEQQARDVMNSLANRLKECKLEMHPEKTKIVYCKDDNRKGDYPNRKLDFLGYTYRPRVVKNSRTDQRFIGFTPAVSAKAQKAMRQKIRKSNLRNLSNLELEDISRKYNPILRGWIEYYGKYNPSEMVSTFKHFNKTLATWAMKKYKRLAGRKIRAAQFIEKNAKNRPGLFVHWMKGIWSVAT
jgi:RNA-directed DNA polymerase